MTLQVSLGRQEFIGNIIIALEFGCDEKNLRSHVASNDIGNNEKCR